MLATRFHPLSQNLIVDCCKKATIRVKTDNRIEKSRSGLGGAVQGILLREAVCSQCIHKTFFAFAPFHLPHKPKQTKTNQAWRRLLSVKTLIPRSCARFKLKGRGWGGGKMHE